MANRNNNDDNDIAKLVTKARRTKKSYPDPLTFLWRCHHSVAYFVGAWGFLIGSLFYLPNNYFLTPGGWLFSIGAFGMLRFISYFNTTLCILKPTSNVIFVLV